MARRTKAISENEGQENGNLEILSGWYYKTIFRIEFSKHLFRRINEANSENERKDTNVITCSDSTAFSKQ